MFQFKKVLSRIKDKMGRSLWFPVVVSERRLVTTKQLAREIAARSGASEGDVVGILRDLSLVMREHLSSGSRVVVDGVGAFKATASASGNGVLSEAEVSASQFNRMSVLFVPEAQVSRIFKTRELSLIDPSLVRFALSSEPSSKRKAKGMESSSEASNSDSGGTLPSGGGDDSSRF